MFFKGSRYASVTDLVFTDPDGREARYKKTRFIPETRAQAAHLVREGERLDHLANLYYRDPERFWRICDANLAMWPEDLVSVAGRAVLIPPPEG